MASSFLKLSPPRIWREMVEHLLHTLVEVLDVSIRFARKRVAGRSAPNQFLRVRIVQVDDQGSYLVGALRRRRVAESSSEPASPSPTASEIVVVGVESLVTLIHLHCHDGNIASGFHLLPAFRCQRGIDGRFDSIDPQRVLCVNLLPGVRFVLAEIRAAVKIGLYLLRK